MKQHITVEQLDELTGIEKRKLLKWQQSKEYDHFHDIDGSSELSEMSIGEMIEFLDEHKEGEINLESGPYNHGVDTYKIGNYEFKNNCLIGWDGELCDALWEAVKEVLEK